MTVSTIKMTARQFLKLGEDPPGVRLELVDGEIAASPSPVPNHSFIVVKLARILDEYVEAHDLGEVFTDVDTIFGEHDVRRPDLLFFAKDRLHLIGDKAMEGPPDLCVEVLSPSSVKIDRRDKFEQYAKGEVRHYWIVDVDAQSVEAYRLVTGAYVLDGKGQGAQIVRLQPFPGLEIAVGRLWRKKRGR